MFTAPDGTPRLAIGGDRTVWIWDPATGTQDAPPFTGHDDRVSAAAVFTAPDGTPRLATGGYDEMVRIWDPATGTQDGPPLTGHDGRVLAVAAFTAPDGTPRLATGSHDQTVRIWNLRTRTAHTLFLADPVHVLAEHRGLLIAGTSSGYLAIDISSVPTSTA